MNPQMVAVRTDCKCRAAIRGGIAARVITRHDDAAPLPPRILPKTLGHRCVASALPQGQNMSGVDFLQQRSALLRLHLLAIVVKCLRYCAGSRTYGE
jgi:hypothetical protein